MNRASTTAGVTATREDDVLTLTLDNPGRRNALTWLMYEQLEEAAEAARADDGLRAVVVRGTASDGFAAGTDISQFAEFTGAADGLDYERRVEHVLRAVQAIPLPTIALVQGAAVGAGLAVAASCDLIVAERDAVFGAPVARTLGNCLPAHVVARVAARMGTARALGMLLTAELLTAEVLAPSGFVHRLADPGGLDTAAETVLRGIRRSAPITLRAVKETVRRIEAAAPVPGNDDLLELCYGSRDFAEGVAAFTQKRHPRWEGA